MEKNFENVPIRPDDNEETSHRSETEPSDWRAERRRAFEATVKKLGEQVPLILSDIDQARVFTGENGKTYPIRHERDRIVALTARAASTAETLAEEAAERGEPHHEHAARILAHMLHYYRDFSARQAEMVDYHPDIAETLEQLLGALGIPVPQYREATA